MNYLQRPELMREADSLPSHYWEPMPDEDNVAEYNARFGDEYEATDGEDDELPFYISQLRMIGFR